MLDGRHHGVGKHDQRDMPMPAMPRPGFVMIQSELVLGGLEAVLDRPTAALNADERVYRSSCRAPCGEVSEISISDIAPVSKPRVHRPWFFSFKPPASRSANST